MRFDLSDESPHRGSTSVRFAVLATAITVFVLLSDACKPGGKEGADDGGDAAAAEPTESDASSDAEAASTTDAADAADGG